jgi:oligopeptide/dipeptide ABC transporter ATP-binding protein
MKSIPSLDARVRGERLHAIPGNVPTFKDIPAGCPFHNRCDEVMDVCRKKRPDATLAGRDHLVRCWRYADA